MHRTRRVQSGVLVLLTALSMTACSSNQGRVAGGQYDASWVKSYSTLAQLASDSAVIVEAKVQPNPQVVDAGQAGASGLSASIFTAVVTKSLKGNTDVGDALKVRQFGTQDAPAFSPTEVTFLQPGQTYALYLQPFEFQSGVSTGQYVVVGQIGAYQLSNGTFTRSTTRDKLPRTVNFASLQRSAKSS